MDIKLESTDKRIMNKIKWKVLSLDYKLSLQLNNSLYRCIIKDNKDKVKAIWEDIDMLTAIESAIDQLGHV